MREVNRVLVAYEDVIIPEDFNHRKTLGNLEGLADTIERDGLLQPLLVREGGAARTDGKRKFFLAAGERRYMAIGILIKRGSTKFRQGVEVKLTKGNERELRRKSIVENLQREDPPALEQAQAFKEYMEEYSLTQSQFAKEFGVSEPLVSQRLALLTKAIPEVREAVEKGQLSATHAREIVSLPKAQQKEMLEEVTQKQKEGRKVTSSEVKDSADRRKAALRRTRAPEVDKDKVKAAKEAYADVDMNLRPKQSILEMIGVLRGRAERASSDDTKRATKSHIAALEWVLSIRESLG
jgi:ParB/RepB/Spo0J family partition protein